MTVREGRGTPAGRRWPLVVGGAVVVLGVALALALGWLHRPGGPSPDGPSPNAPAVAATRLDAGWSHTCWVEEDGSVACWGANTGGELGLGIRSPARREPVRVLGPEARVVSVSAGAVRSCALTDAGAVWCWGQVMFGDVSPTFPVAVAGLAPGVRSVSAGGSHVCAVAGDRSVWCWGENQSGQLGGERPQYDDEGVLLSGVERSDVPLRVPGLDEVVSVVAGGTHTCALTTRAGVVCWGENFWGQLGQGAPASFDEQGRPVSGIPSSDVPLPVTGLDSGVVALAGGSGHTCAVTTRRGAVCWGSNEEGQLGQEVPSFNWETGQLLSGIESSGSPLPVVGLEGVLSLSAGGNHTCAVVTGAGVLCWGSNSSGQLGQKPPPSPTTAPSRPEPPPAACPCSCRGSTPRRWRWPPAASTRARGPPRTR